MNSPDIYKQIDCVKREIAMSKHVYPTEVLKAQSLSRLAPRTEALHALFDKFTGVNIQNN